MRRRELLTASAALALSRPLFGQTGTARRGPVVWLDLDQAALDAAYDQSVWAPTQTQLVARRDAQSRIARERLGPPQRFAYGPTPVETLDVYTAPNSPSPAPVHVHIHGGAWRAGRAEQHAFAAEIFVANGAHFVVPDFAWVQDVGGDLEVVADQVRRSVHWVYGNAHRFGGDPERIYVSGHSSGAHLAGVVLTTEWTGVLAAPANLVKGGLCCSGMFDLAPVRLSARSSYVHLTDQSEAALSPQRHIDRLTAPLILAYGDHESPEFQRQSRDFAAAVRAAGKPVELILGEGYNHFEIIETLANPFGLLGRAVLAQMSLSRAAG